MKVWTVAIENGKKRKNNVTFKTFSRNFPYFGEVAMQDCLKKNIFISNTAEA